ncbi:uncharacterized protein LOC111630299 [Centruroides sculpturatus]|uniref:uncharacterized protein LOC111630299 n=1 Tax=Centruroides sculpturatus TaxID=218467 RepID=UPI000C6E6AD0|nr:uncharacterized protein LOC111630299 [Centruroides sculpturatus]
MHPDEVKDAVQKVMKDMKRKNSFNDDRPGKKWLKLFLKRHPNIAVKNTEVISKARAAVSKKMIRNWFQELNNYLREEHASDILQNPSRIFNAYETRMLFCPKTGKLLGPKAYKNFYNISSGQEKQCITVLCNFSASGQSVDPMIVFP